MVIHFPPVYRQQLNSFFVSANLFCNDRLSLQHCLPTYCNRNQNFRQLRAVNFLILELKTKSNCQYVQQFRGLSGHIIIMTCNKASPFSFLGCRHDTARICFSVLCCGGIAAERRRLQSIDISCRGASSRKLAARRCCCQSMGQTDGRTLDRFIDPAPSSVNK